MTYLLLSIILTSSLILFFKVFEKYKIDIFQALVFNYLTASSIGFLTGDTTSGIEYFPQWLPISILLGGLFISIFYAVSLTAIRISVSAATVANKMSVVIPVSVAFCLYKDPITVQKVVGITLALAAVYMTSRRENTSVAPLNGKQLILLPVIVFTGSGIIDAVVNYAQVNYLHGQNNELFLAVAFGAAFIAGASILFVRLILKKIKIEFRNIVAGICLGIPNFFSIFTLIKALDAKLFESSVLYPVNNMGVVTVSAVAAYLFFREKLSMLNLFGIICALISIILISINLI
ncbi:MAG: EamA/RhaT family transporter [Bacteroidetes bacterium]|nr:EamA/RhaT family transporter [Bacteroidota bacterium]